MWLLMACMPSSLRSYLQVHGAISAELRGVFFSQLKFILQLLHSKSILHGDLKPANMMVDVSRKELRLCNFHLSVDEAHASSDQVAYTGPYRAPELWAQFGSRGKVSKASEAFAYACCVVEACPASPLFPSVASLKASL